MADASADKVAEDRLLARLARDIAAAQAQITAAADYISTRRGGVGAQARTRLAEAERHLAAALQLEDENSDEALKHAHAAAQLATRATQLAQADVRDWEDRHRPRGGRGRARWNPHQQRPPRRRQQRWRLRWRRIQRRLRWRRRRIRRRRRFRRRRGPVLTHCPVCAWLRSAVTMHTRAGVKVRRRAAWSRGNPRPDRARRAPAPCCRAHGS